MGVVCLHQGRVLLDDLLTSPRDKYVPEWATNQSKIQLMKEVTKDMTFVMNNCLDPYIDWAEKFGNDIAHLMEVLDPVLDKPFKDDTKYACGDFLEELQAALHDIGVGLKYAKRIVAAKATAWSLFPENIVYEEYEDWNDGIEYDENASARAAYVQGYMHATEK